MNISQTLLLVVAAILWLLLVLVHAMRIRLPLVSKFETDRLADMGVGEAVLDKARRDVAPRLRVLQQMIETIIIVMVSVLTVGVFGWFVGTLLALMIIMQKGALAKLSPVTSVSRRYYDQYEQVLIEKAAQWSWLDWFGTSTDPATATVSSKAELEKIITDQPELLGRDERLRFLAGIHFDEKTIKDVMTPRAMIDSANADDIIGPYVLDELHKTGHSRFPVIEQDIDHVVGILYLHSLIDMKSSKQSVRHEMNPKVHYVHQDQSLEHALHAFLHTKHHLFIVVNDYRETVGIVSLEDVLEALIGKRIVDEFDRFDDLRAVAESNPRKNNLPKGKKDI